MGDAAALLGIDRNFYTLDTATDGSVVVNSFATINNPDVAEAFFQAASDSLTSAS